MKEKLKNERGITLIALVVTIVVLLILAGVSISLILDNNGIIRKSKDAKREYGQAKENEQADLNNISTWIEKETENNEPEIVEPENINDWEYIEEEDGTITITQYIGNETKIIIPNHINGKAVKRLYAGRTENMPSGNRSFWGSEICASDHGYKMLQNTITEIIISQGIEILDDSAFFYTMALESVEIPDTVTTIGKCAFLSCGNLKSVTIPGKVRSIGTRAFSNIALTEIDIPQSVTTMGTKVFAGIQSITVNVPFKEGETPEGWDEEWNATYDSSQTITVNYIK